MRRNPDHLNSASIMGGEDFIRLMQRALDQTGRLDLKAPKAAETNIRTFQQRVARDAASKEGRSVGMQPGEAPGAVYFRAGAIRAMAEAEVRRRNPPAGQEQALTAELIGKYRELSTDQLRQQLSNDQSGTLGRQAAEYASQFRAAEEERAAASDPNMRAAYQEHRQQSSGIRRNEQREARLLRRIEGTGGELGGPRQQVRGGAAYLVASERRYGIDSKQLRTSADVEAQLDVAAESELLAGGLEGEQRDRAVRSFAGMEAATRQQLLQQRGIRAADVAGMSAQLASEGRLLMGDAGPARLDARSTKRSDQLEQQAKRTATGRVSAEDRRGLSNYLAATSERTGIRTEQLGTEEELLNASQRLAEVELLVGRQPREQQEEARQKAMRLGDAQRRQQLRKGGFTQSDIESSMQDLAAKGRDLEADRQVRKEAPDRRDVAADAFHQMQQLAAGTLAQFDFETPKPKTPAAEPEKPRPKPQDPDVGSRVASRARRQLENVQPPEVDSSRGQPESQPRSGPLRPSAPAQPSTGRIDTPRRTDTARPAARTPRPSDLDRRVDMIEQFIESIRRFVADIGGSLT